MNKNNLTIFYTLLETLLSIIIIGFIYAAILMWLWNAVIAPLFSISIITYWQAYAIYIISNILFKPWSMNKND